METSHDVCRSSITWNGEHEAPYKNEPEDVKVPRLGRKHRITVLRLLQKEKAELVYDYGECMARGS